MKDAVGKFFEALLARLQRVSLQIGIMQSGFEPLCTKVAFKLVGFNVVFLPHFLRYEKTVMNTKVR